MKKTPMTLRGAKKLRKELDKLKKIKRPQIISLIAEAREHGDLKENAEYYSAREEQGFCEGKIQEIETKLANAQIIDIKKIPNNGKIIFGTTVTILNINLKKKFTYRIVGDDEANLKENLISVNSPMARGLISKMIGDNTIIQTPCGKIKYKILQIKYI
ncbi:transcription elongation factor GreA [Candidatus Purcelliella pentastirinorum]|uniref:Transcription elongation factor GreA n=1 Tax=Candidatus Purcelliella pentastirinorum TaxID=472834 RepID=A0A346E092_9ENTR|nr:transcription elongation factor GreA [Candidatus Purcelliella pentastirinorum]AXN02397.1 Transcription elongation factor GreA [Candidatus Purcelliella pentastirinorum]WDI78939.1 transcription elongation factor GreA [Candidatus Purcelliella pentastirinorum]WDR80075.1 transcription elongation factor GreA [Candidatus Purcelliella pentastirinorum]